MRKIRVIQIGIGHDHATTVLDSILKQSDIFDVAALAVCESEKAYFSKRIKHYSDKLSVMTVDDALKIAHIDPQS